MSNFDDTAPAKVRTNPKQSLIKISHTRPETKCFDFDADEEDAKECEQQWTDFDADCMDEWNKECIGTYLDLEEAWCKHTNCNNKPAAER